MAGRRTQWKSEKLFLFPARGSQFPGLEKPGYHSESTAGRSLWSCTGSKWRVGESHCLSPFSPVFLWLLRTVSKWSRHWSHSKNLIMASVQPFLVLLYSQSPFWLWVQYSSTTRMLHNILSHSAVTWHSSVLMEIKPRCICVTWYIYFSGTGWW